MKGNEYEKNNADNMYAFTVQEYLPTNIVWENSGTVTKTHDYIDRTEKETTTEPDAKGVIVLKNYKRDNSF